jgi:hypothetical protein
MTTGGGGGRADAAASSRATEVCVAALKARMERLAFCQENTLDYRSYAGTCPDFYFGPDSNRSVEEVAGCVADLAAQPCSDVQFGIAVPCLNRPGKLPLDADCTFSSQCESKVCGFGFGSFDCGSCMSGPAPVGARCDSTIQCEPGATCDAKTRICVVMEGLTRAAEGEPCNLDFHPLIFCLGDRICQNRKCVMPLAGIACGAVRCPQDKFCKDKATGTCADRAGLGQPCDTSYSDDPPCLTDLLCFNGRCVERKAPGAPCDENDCGEFRECVHGVCQILTCAPSRFTLY